jgi:hypothetical protein
VYSCQSSSVHNNLVVAGLAERVAEPLETFVETITRRGASGLNVLRDSCVSILPEDGAVRGGIVPKSAGAGCADRACR